MRVPGSSPNTTQCVAFAESWQAQAMSLILRPMSRTHPGWNGADDYAVFSGELPLGRILRTTQSNQTPGQVGTYSEAS